MRGSDERQRERSEGEREGETEGSEVQNDEIVVKLTHCKQTHTPSFPSPCFPSLPLILSPLTSPHNEPNNPKKTLAYHAPLIFPSSTFQHNITLTFPSQLKLQTYTHSPFTPFSLASPLSSPTAWVFVATLADDTSPQPIKFLAETL